jgi:CLIP-associating protein 1/2
LASDHKEIQIEVLQSLIDMLKCPELSESFSNYAELLVLKVIRAHKFDDQKFDVSSSSRTTVKYPEVYSELFFMLCLINRHKKL